MDYAAFPLNVKEAADTGRFRGLASVYSTPDRQGDVVARGAFAKSLTDTGGSFPLLFGHDQSKVIGVVKATDSSEGLMVDGQLALEVEAARESHALLKLGGLKGLSIGFMLTDYETRRDGGRLLKSIDLAEVSLVAVPAHPQARVAAVKSLTTIREFESWLRDAGGFSRSQARGLAEKGWKGLTDQHDDEEERLAAWLTEQSALLRA